MNLPSILTPDLGLLFWMFIAFFIVFLLLRKYGFPVIVQMVEERKRYIDESLQNARAANEKLAGIQAESERLLADARRQQASILKEAKATGEKIVAEARNRAQAEGNRLLEEAKAQILAEKENALRDIRGTVADLSVGIAEKVLRKQLSSTSEQTAYVDRLLNEMEGQK